MKKILMILSLLLCITALCGCGAPDAAELLQGSLDLVYRNQYTADYLKAAGLTEPEAQQQYETAIEAELTVFADYFSIDLSRCAPETLEQLRDVCRTICGSAKYEVSKPAKADSGYTVTLTVYPVDILQKFRAEDLPPLMSSWQTRYDKGDFDAMSDEAYEKAWVTALLDALNPRLKSIGYLEGETITATLTRDSDGVTVISPADLAKIDKLVLAY